MFDESGRIVRNTDPDRGAGPRLYLGGCETGNVVCLRHDVGAKTARAVEAMAADEPPLRAPDSVPTHVDDYVALLAAEAPVEQRGHGVNYCFPPDFAYEHDVTIVSSDMPEAERAALGVADDQALPEPLVAIGFSTVAKVWTPWCVALHDGEIASLVETVRIGPTGAEAGVNTVPNLPRTRLRGCGDGGLGRVAVTPWTPALLQHRRDEHLVAARHRAPRAPASSVRASRSPDAREEVRALHERKVHVVHDAGRRRADLRDRVHHGHGGRRRAVEVGTDRLEPAPNRRLALDLDDVAVFDGPVRRHVVADLPHELALDARLVVDDSRQHALESGDPALLDRHETEVGGAVGGAELGLEANLVELHARGRAPSPGSAP